MSEETWEEKAKRVEQAWLKEAEAAWPKYKDKKPIKRDSWAGEVELTYLDWVKQNNDEVRTKTTAFRFKSKDAKTPFMKRSFTSKSQCFLVVSGPEAGRRITTEDAGKDHVLFNISYRNKKFPRCVLVHVSSLKS